MLVEYGSPDSIVRVIQSALTPVFLLTAVASLLGVFTTRLARISDQVNALAKEVPRAAGPEQSVRRRLAFLKRRSHVLDIAVVLGAVAGASDCGTVLALLIGLLRSKATPALLFVLFGFAILCTIGALAAFLAEVLMASRGIRVEAASRAREGAG